ncbi:MAG TPA: hypothetical protein VFT22_18030 [Kofleriaceae bacterium]|nr:hypothetical protein [Kofleriaceae bacterium]
MRAIASLLVLLAVGCVPGDDQPTTTATTSELTQAFNSVIWTAGGDCAPSVPCDGNFLWPSGAGITSAYVLIRSAPDMNGSNAYFAFVVWNRSVVGRIVQVQAGAPNGTDLRLTISNVLASKTFGFLDRSSGSTGNGGSTPTPQPHPNVDGTYQFSAKFLSTVTTHASAIQDSTEAFLATAYE